MGRIKHQNQVCALDTIGQFCDLTSLEHVQRSGAGYQHLKSCAEPRPVLSETCVQSSVLAAACGHRKGVHLGFQSGIYTNYL